MKNFRSLGIHLFVLPALALLGGRALGQRVEDYQVGPPRNADFSDLGRSAAIEGEWAVAGDPTSSAVKGGACLVYRRTDVGWELWQTLKPTADSWSQLFGYSVALHGGELVIGARRGGRDHAGRVHIYHLVSDRWIEVQQLRAFDGGYNYAFGESVAFDAQTLVVGSYGYLPAGSYGYGTCYVYERGGGGWVLSERIPRPDHTQTPHHEWAFFGWSCSVEDDVMVIGAPSNHRQGMAFVYRKGALGWQREADLYLPQYAPQIDMTFGHRVEVSGGTIAVSAPVPIGAWAPGPSSVWIFEYDSQLQSWVQVQWMRASDWGLVPEGDRFGVSLVLRGDRMIVGAERGGYNGPLSGTAYVFERDNGVWSEVERLLPSDPNPYPGSSSNPSVFGSAVALDDQNGRILVGAIHAHAPGYQGFPFPGKAYFFDVNQGTVVCNGFSNATNAPTRLTVTGSRVVGDANLSLSVYDGPPGLVGIFLVGPGGPPRPFGVGGSLCIGQPVSLLTGIRTIGPDGSAMHQVDFTAPPASNLLFPGATLTFQFAHRDQVVGTGLPTINASDAVEVVFQ